MKKVICSFPRQSDSWVFDGLNRAGKIKLELVPQGNLAERIRRRALASAPSSRQRGVGTLIAAGKERRTIGARDYILEYAIHADYAFISAYKADRWGNLVYRKTAHNFGPIMAAAARTTVAQLDEIVELGSIDPESVVNPGLFVDRVVALGERPWLEGGALVVTE
ncbi:3-oxoacid CoA-transferase subunit A [Lacisediminihabitans sp. FW035]